jgi:hypothetical protein
MAREKGLKKAPGRLIGRWKDEAITANPGASDEDLARIINDMAQKGGYHYTITPEKVRKPGAKPAPAPAPARPSEPAPARGRADGAGGALVEDLRAFVRLVGKEGAKDLVADMIDRL